jgi:hypothetical protein
MSVLQKSAFFENLILKIKKMSSLNDRQFQKRLFIFDKVASDFKKYFIFKVMYL